MQTRVIWMSHIHQKKSLLKTIRDSSLFYMKAIHSNIIKTLQYLLQIFSLNNQNKIGTTQYCLIIFLWFTVVHLIRCSLQWDVITKRGSWVTCDFSLCRLCINEALGHVCHVISAKLCWCLSAHAEDWSCIANEPGDSWQHGKLLRDWLKVFKVGGAACGCSVGMGNPWQTLPLLLSSLMESEESLEVASVSSTPPQTRHSASAHLCLAFSPFTPPGHSHPLMVTFHLLCLCDATCKWTYNHSF